MVNVAVDLLVGGIISLAFFDTKSVGVDHCYHIQHPNYAYTKTPLNSLPECASGFHRIVIVSDTHGCHWRLPKLPTCQTLIHCGDVLMTSKYFSYAASKIKLDDFNDWLKSCPAEQRIVIGGNHDHFMQLVGKEKVQSILTNATYVVNEHINIGNMTAWATPHSMGRSPNRAFQSKAFLGDALQARPAEVDVLITHGQCPELTSGIKHKVHIWGHSHNSYGIRYPGDRLRMRGREQRLEALSICAPMMDGRFRMRNLPVVLDLPIEREDLAQIPTAEDIAEHAFSYVPSASSKLMESLSGKVKYRAAQEEPLCQQKGTTTTKRQRFLGLHYVYKRVFANKVVPVEGQNACNSCTATVSEV